MNAGLIIAVDGPSGAGKSSSSRLLAERLGYRYVDTGALYRVVGLLAIEKGVPADDAQRLAALCHGLALRFAPEAGGVRVLLGERDITAAIRQPEVSQMASKVSAQPLVRQQLLTVQRELGAGGRVVMEGRDIGTVVFPEADVKFYLDASPEVRGRRRYTELQEQGVSADLQKTIQEMTERDQRDRSRAYAPLQQAADAVLIDTTALSLKEVVETMVRTVQAARKC
ncbi:MAG TPA: (d)CMP kinase [Methylomirabilota bacterium]|jgi:cytidylate kinase|nr:(d)CMP kinase [Methylomirabilota bacterium]